MSGRGPVQPCGTLAAYRRHQRHGEQPCYTCTVAAHQARGGTGGRVIDTREVRNGIPFKPYTYNGLGCDAITGEVVTL